MIRLKERNNGFIKNWIFLAIVPILWRRLRHTMVAFTLALRVQNGGDLLGWRGGLTPFPEKGSPQPPGAYVVVYILRVRRRCYWGNGKRWGNVQGTLVVPTTGKSRCVKKNRSIVTRADIIFNKWMNSYNDWWEHRICSLKLCSFMKW